MNDSKRHQTTLSDVQETADLVPQLQAEITSLQGKLEASRLELDVAVTQNDELKLEEEVCHRAVISATVCLASPQIHSA